MSNEPQIPVGTASAPDPYGEPEVSLTASGGVSIPGNYRAVGPGHTPVQTIGGTGRRILIAVIVLTVALLAIYLFGRYTRGHELAQLQATALADADQPPEVDTAQVVRAGSARLLTLPGDARAFYETTIFARTSGYLKKWNVDIGDHVKEGQVLATIETPELDDQLRESQTRADALRAHVKVAQSVADFAKLSYDRFDTGTPDGVVSQQERDQRKSDLESAIAQVEASKADLAAGQTDVDRLQTLEGFKQVMAPFEGIITERHVDLGDLITAGSSSSTTSLFRIAQSDKIRVFVDVPQNNSGEIHVGMPVSACAPENPQIKYQGKVDRTSGSIDPTTRMLKVQVLVDNPNLSLLPGTYLQVEFQTQRSQPPLRIPAAALTMRADGPQVAVVAADGSVTFHKVNIDRDLGDYVEISHGLAEGEMVALNISRDVSEGGHVLAHPESTAPVTALVTPAPTPVAAVMNH